MRRGWDSAIEDVARLVTEGSGDPAAGPLVVAYAGQQPLAVAAAGPGSGRVDPVLEVGSLLVPLGADRLVVAAPAAQAVVAADGRGTDRPRQVQVRAARLRDAVVTPVAVAGGSLPALLRALLGLPELRGPLDAAELATRYARVLAGGHGIGLSAAARATLARGSDGQVDGPHHGVLDCEPPLSRPRPTSPVCPPNPNLAS